MAVSQRARAARTLLTPDVQARPPARSAATSAASPVAASAGKGRADTATAVKLPSGTSMAPRAASKKAAPLKVSAKKTAASKPASKKAAPSKTVVAKKAARVSPSPKRAAHDKVRHVERPSPSPVPPSASQPTGEPLALAVDAMGQSMGAALQSLAGLSMPPAQLQGIQQDYVQQAAALWNQMLSQPSELQLADKRFAAPQWTQHPASAFMAAMYLLNARTLQRLADTLQGDEKTRQRVRFAVQQWVDAAAPSNFLAFNPEALDKALSTQGESITQGLQNVLHDIGQGHLSQTDESVFEVGVNVATTAGSVVFENAYFQLVEYAPITPKVHATPLLIVPPCINKFYIFDLQPDNSLVRYLLSQGHHLFMVSWVNADDSLAHGTWDDYVEHGVTKAIDVTRSITGADQINAMGFCVGGTLLSTALATLAAQGRKPVQSLTLLTAFLDFVNTGTMDVFVDEAMVRMREMTIGPNSPTKGGLIRGAELATTFSFLRANDLVWNYVIGNYLKGEKPPAFDLLYWNSDSTNLPGPMYTWYLRNTYLENKLCQPGAVTVCGVPLDLRRLDMPTFIYGSREDHIVPWDSAYASTQIVTGPVTFVLGASGHVAGVINPPQKKKRSFWTSSARQLPVNAKAWLESSEENPGSWWTKWAEWLVPQSGALVPAPRQLGSKHHPVIEPAPGRYVKRKA